MDTPIRMERLKKLSAFIVCIAVFCSGCATQAVWGIKSCSPSKNTNLQIAFAPDNYDFLVRYDEEHGFSKGHYTQAYWLLSYEDSQHKGRHPEFIDSTTNHSGLIEVPVVDLRTSAPPTNGYYAIMLPEWGSFDLYRNDVGIGRFQLPNYFSPAKPANFWRVVATPPAVVVDTATTAVVVGALLFLLSGGAGLNR